MRNSGIGILAAFDHDVGAPGSRRDEFDDENRVVGSEQAALPINSVKRRPADDDEVGSANGTRLPGMRQLQIEIDVLDDNEVRGHLWFEGEQQSARRVVMPWRRGWAT